jgi:hypothetical protein
MGQTLSGAADKSENLLSKENKYDDKVMSRIANKFNAEDTCLVDLLDETLKNVIKEMEVISTKSNQNQKQDKNNYHVA